MNEYQNPQLCAECGGKCCRHYAGAAWPDDFDEPLAESLDAALASGEWAIDWWEGELDGMESPYFVRPRHKNEPIVHGSWGGECVFFTGQKCRLPFEKRPRGCRLLEPRADGCIDHAAGDSQNQKAASCRAWKPYQSLLTKLAEKYGSRHLRTCDLVKELKQCLEVLAE